MKTLLKYTVLLLLIAIMGGACKNKNIIETPFTRLTDTWRLSKTATDANGNGKIDPSEYQNVPEGYISDWTFYDDSTGNETTQVNGITTVLFFTFSFTKQDSIIRRGVGYNNITYFLENINPLSLQLTTRTNVGLTEYYFKKK